MANKYRYSVRNEETEIEYKNFENKTEAEEYCKQMNDYHGGYDFIVVDKGE